MYAFVHASAAELCITVGKERFSARLNRLTRDDKLEAGVDAGSKAAGIINGADETEDEEFSSLFNTVRLDGDALARFRCCMFMGPIRIRLFSSTPGVQSAQKTWHQDPSVVIFKAPRRTGHN